MYSHSPSPLKRLSERSQKFAETSLSCLLRLKWLQTYISYVTFKKGAIKSQTDELQLWKNAPKIKITKVDLSFSVSGEWSIFSSLPLLISRIGQVWEKKMIFIWKFCQLSFKNFNSYKK